MRIDFKNGNRRKKRSAKKKGFTVNSLIIQILWGYVEAKRGVQE